MATIPYFSQRYSYPGPRQGVYISPAVRWRSSQFKSPEDTYSYRARLEPQPVANYKFPARIVKRQASTGSVQTRPSSACSSCDGAKSRASITSSKSSLELSKTSSSFTLTAQTVIMKPKPQRPQSSIQQSRRPYNIKTNQSDSYSYPDPTKIKGNPCFDVRMAELAKLECDAIKQEERKARLSAKNSNTCASSRPTSARSQRPGTSRPATPSQRTTLPLYAHSSSCAAPPRRSNRQSSSRSCTVSARPNGTLQTSVDTTRIQRSVSACSIGSVHPIQQVVRDSSSDDQESAFNSPSVVRARNCTAEQSMSKPIHDGSMPCSNSNCDASTSQTTLIRIDSPSDDVEGSASISESQETNPEVSASVLLHLDPTPPNASTIQGEESEAIHAELESHFRQENNAIPNTASEKKSTKRTPTSGKTSSSSNTLLKSTDSTRRKRKKKQL